MADPHLFEITEGYFGLLVVNTAATGYAETWQSPVGDTGTGSTATLLTAELTDYESAASGWTCQMTSGAVNGRPSTTTVTRKPTFCAPGATIPSPDETAFELAISFYQDPDVVNSLSLWLLDHDTEEAYAFLAWGSGPQKLVGRVRIATGTIGGDPRTPLEATLTLPFSGKPLVERADAA